MKIVYLKIIRPSFTGGDAMPVNSVLEGTGPLSAKELDDLRDEMCSTHRVKLQQVVVCNVMDLVD